MLSCGKSHFWTSLHLELLDCKFFDGGIIETASEQPPNTAAVPMPATSTGPSYSTPTDFAAERLAKAQDTFKQQDVLSQLVGGIRNWRFVPSSPPPL